MILTYGIVDFFNIQNNYANYQSNPDQFVKLLTNVITPFVIITDNEGDTATMDVLDISGDSVESGISLTVADNDDVKQLSYDGATLTDQECGHYQLRITHGDNIYYSEFFEWSDDVSNFIKITINPYKILVNNVYTVDLSSYQFVFYLKSSGSFNSRVLELSGETNEDGVTKNYGDEPLKTTINFEYQIELIGNDAMFKFMSMIRPSCIDGSAYFEYNSRSKKIYNTSVEQSDNSNFGEKIVIKLTFREENWISNSNE